MRLATRPVATFSIAAADVKAHEVGVAVASKFLAVGAVVPWVKADVGAVATQAYANTAYGPRALQLLGEAVPPDAVVDTVTRSDPGRSERQVGIVASDGTAATYTGDGCSPWAGGLSGSGYAIQGNILTGAQVVEAMRDAFEDGDGALDARLLAALAAGEKAGGDSRGRQSAALVVAKTGGGYGGFNDRYIDLRVDDHADPVRELARILELHRLYLQPTQAADLVEISPEVAVQIQRMLRTTGDIQGSTSGFYDETTRESLRRLFGRENLEERWHDDAAIDRVALEYLISRYLQ